MDKPYTEDFEYTHKNPYHDKLTEFDEFVLRDHEAEEHKGLWNKEIFKRDAPLCLEIGSGYGHFMLDYCEKYPTDNFVGLDYRFKRSYALAKKLARHPYQNFRYLRAKGERIEFMFAENELDKLFYFFPDPWPKKRHMKKRLFQKNFLERAYKVLKPGGYFFIKTDHDGYGEWMKEIIEDQDLFEVELMTTDLWNEPEDNFLKTFKTKFEKIFLEQGINIKAFILKSKKSS
ncbi:tRNA (guanosine(46)-N7)-methyltransferase TrmB [Bacteriovorax sp. Seq25_V]|uniref:tRNA (guanosine(46)-N7)-methyltransferase TrmB n=1 Tax=Bacteriovorax sp. Seq25_V TaxID=1201288 RepID=UPI000389E013|nr:tRNA (guanosine(46)-N7)-methyltransferase TrmB [Bacteriovorax sp. Seq25_V]EQC44656.1 tRNA (guanine-N(7)-)-methyltransferase [Bacteriovorax sp. Seq25_V]